MKWRTWPSARFSRGTGPVKRTQWIDEYRAFESRHRVVAKRDVMAQVTGGELHRDLRVDGILFLAIDEVGRYDKVACSVRGVFNDGITTRQQVEEAGLAVLLALGKERAADLRSERVNDSESPSKDERIAAIPDAVAIDINEFEYAEASDAGGLAAHLEIVDLRGRRDKPVEATIATWTIDRVGISNEIRNRGDPGLINTSRIRRVQKRAELDRDAGPFLPGD